MTTLWSTIAITLAVLHIGIGVVLLADEDDQSSALGVLTSAAVAWLTAWVLIKAAG